MSAKRGTDLHDLACKAIQLRIPLHDSNEALAQYVNDAIALNMRPEQPLYYSENCFGTADAIQFIDGVLYIFDLKNGAIAGNLKQLLIYAGIYCLEYGVNPYEILFDLRIYQRDRQPDVYLASPDEVSAIMDKIIESDRYIEMLKEANRW